jgi:hypothetical protein
MVIHHECKANKDASDKMHGACGLPRKISVSRTMNHQKRIHMLALAKNTDMNTGYQCVDEYIPGNINSIVPYMREGGYTLLVAGYGYMGGVVG